MHCSLQILLVLEGLQDDRMQLTVFRLGLKHHHWQLQEQGLWHQKG
jgi:hypothetical protein